MFPLRTKRSWYLVASLCTNFLMVDMLNIIKDNFNKDDQLIRITTTPPYMYLALVSLILAYTSGTFNSHFHQHTSVASMEQPASSTTIETHVLDHKQIAISTPLTNFTNNFLMTFVQFLNLCIWKKLITSEIFIKVSSSI